jgi:hypothetical protein
MTELPKTMKALVKTAEKESYELKEEPVPTPAQGELLVRIRKASICGSDIALYKWNEGTSRLCQYAEVVSNFLTTPRRRVLYQKYDYCLPHCTMP